MGPRARAPVKGVEAKDEIGLPALTYECFWPVHCGAPGGDDLKVMHGGFKKGLVGWVGFFLGSGTPCERVFAEGFTSTGADSKYRR